jgi:hypothetical protein
MRSILDDSDSAPSGKGDDRVDRTRIAAVVKSHDRLRARCDRRFHVGGVGVQVVGTGNVAKDRTGADVKDRVRRGHEIERGHDDLVVGADPDREQREVERCGAAADGECVCCADLRREGSFELLDSGAHAPPSRRDSVIRRPAEFVIDAYIRERDVPRLVVGVCAR